MSNVTSLHGAHVPNGEPNEHLVDALKEILAEAESGRLQCFFGAGFLVDGLRMSCVISSHTNVYEVIGSIEMLKHDYISNHTEPI
jgi:hypothetical protein